MKRHQTLTVVSLLLALIGGFGFSRDLRAKSTVDIGGAFLGIFNSLDQSNRSDTDPKQLQFDFAANIDFSWEVYKNITVTLQVQGGSGEGALGFVGASPVITDLNVEIAVAPSFAVTFGSFDTPFGLETPYLTNNADTSGNSLILNSLFYSALAETNVGTLNTLGVKGEFTGRWGSLTLALTNGTDEASFNGDGNFEWVVFAKSKPLFDWLTLAGSYMKSNDRSISGESGTRSDYSAWMADLEIARKKLLFIRAYYGRVTYGDDLAATDDNVTIWKIETRFDIKSLYLAGKISGWEPGENPNGLIPNPGYSVDFPAYDGPDVYIGQKILRFQAGLGWRYKPNVTAKLEWFFDNYKEISSENTDTKGLLLTCNITF